jgi:hypothetical protein
MGLKRPKSFDVANAARSVKMAERRVGIAARAQPLLDAGMDMKRVAKELGVCRDMIRRLRQEGSIVVRARVRAKKVSATPGWSEEEKALVERLWLEGLPATKIGAQMGRSKGSVLGLVYRLKLVRPDAVAVSRAPMAVVARRVGSSYANPQPQDPRRVQALLGRRVAFDEDMGPAIEEWIAANGVKRCPAAAVAATSARLADEDVAALREYSVAMAPQGNWKDRHKARQWRSW